MTEYLTMSSLFAFFFGSFLFLGLASVLWRPPVLRRLERELERQSERDTEKERERDRQTKKNERERKRQTD